jgi:hypothetical protein
VDAWRKGWGGDGLCSFQPVWFTFWNGIITEIYPSAVGRPSFGSFNISSPAARASTMKRSATSNQNRSRLSDHGLGYRCTNSDPAMCYAIGPRLQEKKTQRFGGNEEKPAAKRRR